MKTLEGQNSNFCLGFSYTDHHDTFRKMSVKIVYVTGSIKVKIFLDVDVSLRTELEKDR